MRYSAAASVGSPAWIVCAMAPILDGPRSDTHERAQRLIADFSLAYRPGHSPWSLIDWRAARRRSPSAAGRGLVRQVRTTVMEVPSLSPSASVFDEAS